MEESKRPQQQLRQDLLCLEAQKNKASKAAHSHEAARQHLQASKAAEEELLTERVTHFFRCHCIQSLTSVQSVMLRITHMFRI